MKLLNFIVDYRFLDVLNLTEAEAADGLGLLGPYVLLTLKYIVQINFFKDSHLEEKVVE